MKSDLEYHGWFVYERDGQNIRLLRSGLNHPTAACYKVFVEAASHPGVDIILANVEDDYEEAKALGLVETPDIQKFLDDNPTTAALFGY